MSRTKIAQAIAEQAVFVTGDSIAERYPVESIADLASSGAMPRTRPTGGKGTVR
jgi:hypothetical protein